ncbi:MAG: ABC transporter substrate-binding protein [Rhodospirillales bacterium]|nr:ABC transporter substrate-binding protein [Rhodospirillales bacterium]
MTPRRWLIIAVIACFTVASSPQTWAEEVKTSPEEASNFLSTLGKEALATLSDQSGSLEEREARVRELLNKSFDFDKIGRFVLGRAWKQATTEQRTEYQKLFSEFVLRTYSQRLGGYSGQSFKVIKSVPLGKKDALVTTEIGRPGGAPPLLCGWRVRGNNGNYKILDVTVEGISMLATQRSEFAALVQRNGVDGLIETLRLQVSKFSAQSSSS